MVCAFFPISTTKLFSLEWVSENLVETLRMPVRSITVTQKY